MQHICSCLCLTITHHLFNAFGSMPCGVSREFMLFSAVGPQYSHDDLGLPVVIHIIHSEKADESRKVMHSFFDSLETPQCLLNM